MTEQPSNITMPPRSQIVTEAVARLDVMGLRSGVLELDTQTLIDLGLLLTDRKVTVRDAGKWLNKELNGSEDEPVVPERNLYRYADSFRRVYGQVRAEHARRIARLTVDHAGQGNVDRMSLVATQRLTDLIAEKLVETDNLEELSGTELSAAITTLQGLAHQRIKQAELALKQAEGERKAARLEADLAKIKSDIQARNADLSRRIAEITKRVDAMSTATAQGKTITPTIFTAIRQELAAMALQTQEVTHGA